MNLQTEIETLSQTIGSLTGALHAKNKQDILFWFSMKSDLIQELCKINHEIDKILIGKMK